MKTLNTGLLKAVDSMYEMLQNRAKWFLDERTKKNSITFFFLGS